MSRVWGCSMASTAAWLHAAHVTKDLLMSSFLLFSFFLCNKSLRVSEALAKWVCVLGRGRLFCFAKTAWLSIRLPRKQMKLSKKTKESGESRRQLNHCHASVRTQCQSPCTHVKHWVVAGLSNPSSSEADSWLPGAQRPGCLGKSVSSLAQGQDLAGKNAMEKQ